MKFLALALILISVEGAWAQTESSASSSTTTMSAAPNGEPPSYDEMSSKYQVKMLNEESRLTFGAYGQFSSFTRQGINLLGWTMEFPINYALTDSLAVQLSIAQSLDVSKSLTVLYTGFHFGGAYAFSGSFAQRKSNLMVNGNSTMNVSTLEKTLWAVEGGLDQILFNGAGRVVPATGLSFGLRSDFNLFGFRASGMLRYGALVITDEPVSMLTSGLGLLIRY